MPVLGWTYTSLSWLLPDGGRALRFYQVAFDLYLLARLAPMPKAEARAYLETLDPTGRLR